MSTPLRPLALDVPAVIRRLRELDGRSGGRRVAWSEVWLEERERLERLVRELVPGVRVAADAFANRWYVLDGAGRADETVLLGSHIDCVPDGGWLDGVLGVHAGLELLSTLARRGARPRRTVALVDWADEEGVRFGRSLLGSSAACGALSRAELDGLRDADGTAAAEIVAAYGFEVDRLGARGPQLDGVACALELHIEQGPILETAGRSVAAVAGCLGVIRTAFAITAGRATPGRPRWLCALIRCGQPPKPSPQYAPRSNGPRVSPPWVGSRAVREFRLRSPRNARSRSTSVTTMPPD